MEDFINKEQNEKPIPFYAFLILLAMTIVGLYLAYWGLTREGNALVVVAGSFMGLGGLLGVLTYFQVPETIVHIVAGILLIVGFVLIPLFSSIWYVLLVTWIIGLAGIYVIVKAIIKLFGRESSALDQKLDEKMEDLAVNHAKSVTTGNVAFTFNLIERAYSLTQFFKSIFVIIIGLFLAGTGIYCLTTGNKDGLVLLVAGGVISAIAINEIRLS